ncbi:MAG: ATP-binding protein, partial [Bacteroidales bacterium]|nr:ATP-binding protein [Bacteroidales bacterium]
MQQLSKVIFMNSATIPHQEFRLDGNIHFIGTQGVGKSTVLRAILFFYTADSRRLGISKEQKPFAEYYFPYVNSYIVYEVNREERTFCVWLQRRRNRLVFRFIDGPYDRDMFINNRETVNEETVIKNYFAKGVKVEKQVTNSEFLDIIFGAKREMRRYCLLESKSYQNIPRTISNIFLNSSLDASFIKQTIIHSLTDDPHVINLETNRYHLETAQKDYHDVLEYKKHEKKAGNIVTAYERIMEIEDAMKQLAWQAGAAYNYSLQELKNLESQIESTQQSIGQKRSEREKANSNAQQEINNLNKKLGVAQEKIKKANKLKKEYEEQDIEKILAESQKKAQYESEREQKAQTLRNLTQKHEDTEQKFEYAVKDVENKLSRDKEYYQNEIATEKEKFHDEKEKLEEYYREYIKKVEDEYNEHLEYLRKQIQDVKLEIRDLENQIKTTREKPYFSEEKQKIDSETSQKQKEEAVKKQQSQQIDQQLKTTRRDWESVLEKTKNHYNSQINETSAKLKQLRADKDETEQKLNKYSNSFIEFLDREKPGWRDDLGKVVQEDLLWRTDLNPQKSTGDDLFGVTLDVSKLEATKLSKSFLEDQLKTLKSEIESSNKSLQQLQQELENERIKIKKKYNKKVKDLQASYKQNQHDLEQLGIKLEHLANEKTRLAEQAEKQRSEDVKAVKENHSEKEQALKKLQDQEKQYSQTLREKKDSLQKEKQKQVEVLKKSRDEATGKHKKEIERLSQKAKEEKETLNEQRRKALKEKGVDTEAIQKLEQERDELDGKLSWLAEKSNLISNYHKDYREYIAKADEFRQERKFLEEKIERRQENLDKRLEAFDREIDALQKDINKLQNNKNHHQREISYMENDFRRQGLYTDYKGFVDNADTYKEDTLTNLTRQLFSQSSQKTQEQKKLLERVSQFTGNFSEDNILHFPVKVQTAGESMDFADQLKDFMNNQKILDFEKEVNQKYAMVLNNIGKETDALLEHEEKVHGVIRKINQDFKNSNFVGVVRSIEMRIKDSDNPLVQVLKAIREFRENNPY